MTTFLRTHTINLLKFGPMCTEVNIILRGSDALVMAGVQGEDPPPAPDLGQEPGGQGDGGEALMAAERHICKLSLTL